MARTRSSYVAKKRSKKKRQPRRRQSKSRRRQKGAGFLRDVGDTMDKGFNAIADAASDTCCIM